jgi:Flp pilus assembly protein CpaB
VLSRWSRPSRRYLVAGLALALVGLLSMRTYLSREARAAGAGGSPVPVVVASADIDRGAALRPEDLRTVSIPRAYAPPGALRTVDQAAGRVALADLAEGPVASLIPAGLRAFAVPTSLPTGTVAPGDLIDVLATYSTGQPHTETVVSGVEVLFVLGTGWGGAPGRSGGAGGGGGSAFDAAAAGAAASGTLILLVSAEQDERLAYARAFADLSIAVEPAAKLPGRMG